MGWLVVLVLVRHDKLEVAWHFGERAAAALIDLVHGLELEEAWRSEGGAAEAETGCKFWVKCVGVDGVSRWASVRDSLECGWALSFEMEVLWPSGRSGQAEAELSGSYPNLFGGSDGMS